MCQAFDGERAYMLQSEKNTRRRGYDAMKAGKPRNSNPERAHELQEYCSRAQWFYGWDTALDGREPW